MLFHADVSDDDDRINSQDASSTSMTCNNHELLAHLFNTNTDITMTNDFSSILNNSLNFEESFDRKNICLECSCTYTDVCIRCEQNRELEIAKTIDKRKDLQQDNDNNSISYQLAESNERNHLMQQKVPSPLTGLVLLFLQSHHQLMYEKLGLKIFLEQYITNKIYTFDWFTKSVSCWSI